MLREIKKNLFIAFNHKKTIVFILQKLNIIIDLCLNAKLFALNRHRLRLKNILQINTTNCVTMPQLLRLKTATFAFNAIDLIFHRADPNKLP